jgi:3',5'-cyclic-AMP phosphodiesterase
MELNTASEQARTRRRAGTQAAVSCPHCASAEQDLGLKVHHAIGNHDIFGVYAKSGIGIAEPGFGKLMSQERIGQTYYSFDHKGYHFVLLDSIQVTADRNWVAGVDATRLIWLKKDLRVCLG